MRSFRFLGLAFHIMLLSFLISATSFAQGCRGYDCNDDSGNPVDVVTTVKTGDLVGGSNTSKSLALASALGDVDIADCLASTQFSILIFAKQGVQLNEWCAALWYDQRGLHELAAGLRCNIPEIAGEFSNDADCVIGNTLQGWQSPDIAPLAATVGTASPKMASGSSVQPAPARIDRDDEDNATDYDRAIAALRAEFEADQAARRRAARLAAAQRAREAAQLDKFMYDYGQLTEQAQQIEEKPTTEELPKHE